MATALLDVWSALHTKVLRLEAAVLLLAACLLLAVGLTVWVVTRPVAIYYIPATPGPGLLQPGAVPDALAADFAAHLLLLLYNVTPPTVEATHTLVATFLHPRFLGAWRAQASAEREQLLAHDISCLTSVRQSTVQPGSTATLRQVEVTALRRIFVGKVHVRDEDLHAVFTLETVPPSPLNPYGLVVQALTVTPQWVTATLTHPDRRTP